MFVHLDGWLNGWPASDNWLKGRLDIWLVGWLVDGVGGQVMVGYVIDCLVEAWQCEEAPA